MPRGLISPARRCPPPHPPRPSSREAAALALVLGFLLVLAVFGGILHLLSASAGRELDSLSGYLRAVAVAEVAFSRIVARLAAQPWSGRWFRAVPDLQTGVRAAGGTYGYLLRDAPVPALAPDALGQMAVLAPRQADLLVRASYERASVVMYWRLSVPEDGLEGLRRVIPSFFTFGPEEVTVSGSAADDLSGMVNEMIARREAARPRFDPLRTTLAQATEVAGVGQALGFTPGRPVLDEVAPMAGGAPRANPPYLAQVYASEIAAPPLAPPPAPAVASPLQPVPPPPTGAAPYVGAAEPPFPWGWSPRNLDEFSRLVDEWLVPRIDAVRDAWIDLSDPVRTPIADRFEDYKAKLQSAVSDLRAIGGDTSDPKWTTALQDLAAAQTEYGKVREAIPIAGFDPIRLVPRSSR